MKKFKLTMVHALVGVIVGLLTAVAVSLAMEISYWTLLLSVFLVAGAGNMSYVAFRWYDRKREEKFNEKE